MFDLRSLNFTPLERGDQNLKEKFYSLASGANISLQGECFFLYRYSTLCFSWCMFFPYFRTLVLYRYNVSIQHIVLLVVKKLGLTVFLFSTLLGLCRSYQQVYRARVVLVGKSFQRPTFSCGTGCSMIFRCHFIEPCAIQHTVHITLFLNCAISHRGA